MSQLFIERIRSGIVESVHRVAIAIVTSDGSLRASSRDPELVTFARSTAKPFQALPLVQDRAMERFNITPQELALACASHSSEWLQVELVKGLLHRIGCVEGDLACGPHKPLGRSFAVPALDPDLLAPSSPLASNCSGKHTGMLALARHHDWKIDGYHKSGHEVQQRIKREVARWTSVEESCIQEGIDGCTAVSFALPLRNLALGFARLANGKAEPERTIVRATVQYPELVAGSRRLGTELMVAYPGEVLVKVGAEGVYVAALPARGLGIALKIEDGHPQAAMVALVATLDRLELDPLPSTVVPQFHEFPVHDTRGESVGCMRAKGQLTFV